MAARFEKVPTPGLTLDGFDESVMQQMVPEGGNRSMGAVTEAESCVLRLANPGIARLTQLRTSAGTPLASEVPPGGLTLVPNSRVTFSIVGVRAGRTELVLVGPDGRFRSFVTISVKKAAITDVAVIQVNDRVHTSTRNMDEAGRILSKVSDIFRPQANMEFRLFGPPAFVFLDEDLGSKVFPAKKAHLDPILDRVRIRRPELTHAKILLFCCWDVADEDATLRAGSFFSRNKGLCFIPDSAKVSEASGIHIIAHEMGHGLGCEDVNKEDHLMFRFTSATDNKLDHFDMDQSNQTGL